MSPQFTIPRFIRYTLTIFLALIALGLILVLALPIGFYGMAMYLSPSLPSVSEIKTAHLEMPLQIYSKDNKLIGQYGNRMSLPVTFNQIPSDLVNAFLAAEDSSFYEHNGISIKGLGRAVTEVITNDDGQTGGSTITMQVAKNYFLTPERTFNRKLTELYLARRIEDELSKEDIMTLYVNKIYLGEGAYGVKAAAKKYYSKSLSHLSLAEFAMLAGLPKAPSQDNPVSNPEGAMMRRNWILGRMNTLGYISQLEYNDAVGQPIGLHLYQAKLDSNMPYLAEMTRRSLISRFGDKIVNSGWRVKLTVDSQAQSAADTALKKGLIQYDRRHGFRGVEANGEPLSQFKTYANMEPAQVLGVDNRSFKAQLKNGDIVTVPWSGMKWAKKYASANRISSYPSRASQIVAKGDIVRLIGNEDRSAWMLTQVPKVQGSLVALDPENGALQTMVGGFDYQYSKFNRAIQAWRQPGSTIKPLNYAAALEKGYRPDSLISDSPLRIGSWEPKNSDGRSYGLIPLRKGLYLSRNLVSIRLLQSIGTTDALHLLGQFGLDKDKLPTTLSLALGAGQATPLQMATAYATFANGGHRIQPYFIDQIYDYDSHLLFLANPQRACAVCFNNNLDALNEALQVEYVKQLDTDIKRREAALQSLQDYSFVSDLGSKPKESSDTSLVTDVDNADLEDETLVTKEMTETEAAIALKEARQDMINALRYDASPQSDRPKPELIQYSVANQAPRILTAGVAYEMANILRDVIQRGTGTRAKVLGRSDIGGKTGTTNEMKDAWFAGFHPRLVSVVWVGFDQPSTLGRGEYGGVAALPIWIDFMRTQLKTMPVQWVSVNNVATSETLPKNAINLSGSEETSLTKSKALATNDSQKVKKDTAKEAMQKPPKPKVTKRPPPKPEPSFETSDTLTSNNNSNSTSTSTPLTVEKVDVLPPLN